MAGNIPLVGFHDFLSVLISGHSVLVKQSSNDKHLLPFLAKYLEYVEEDFKGKITFTEEKLTDFDAIIATGSDNTARYFEFYFKNKPNIIRKSRNSVAVITGKETERDFLIKLGAKEIIHRKDFETVEKRPSLKPSYAGAIDTVGGVILENIIKSTKAMGAITCCGNVASPKLDITVFPFILRGLAFNGIDSQNCPMLYREKVWEKLSEEWKPDQLDHTGIEFRNINNLIKNS